MYKLAILGDSDYMNSQNYLVARYIDNIIKTHGKPHLIGSIIYNRYVQGCASFYKIPYCIYELNEKLDVVVEVKCINY